jgi:hypothetical protein
MDKWWLKEGLAAAPSMILVAIFSAILILMAGLFVFGVIMAVAD